VNQDGSKSPEAEALVDASVCGVVGVAMLGSELAGAVSTAGVLSGIN
jgi:hypothetical protein